MKEFSQEIIECIAQWGKKSVDCNGDVKCLEGLLKGSKELS